MILSDFLLACAVWTALLALVAWAWLSAQSLPSAEDSKGRAA